MTTRNVVLTDHQNQLIRRLIASGRYQNASEAMRAGLRLLEEEEAGVQALINRIDRGLADVEAGRFAEGKGEEVVRRAFAEGAARAEKQKKFG